jgi:hypothetical protein
MGLLKDAAQCSNGNFIVHGYDAANAPLSRRFLQDDMADLPAQSRCAGARTISRPDTIGRLGIDGGYIEGGPDRAIDFREWKFFEVKLSCFAQIGYSFFDGFPLAGGAHFGAVCDVNLVLFVDEGGKRAGVIWQLLSTGLRRVRPPKLYAAWSD